MWTGRRIITRQVLYLVVALSLFGCSDGSSPEAAKSPNADVKRLTCADVKSFIPTAASIRQEFETDPTVEQAIARLVAQDDKAESSALIGDEPANHDEADRTMRGSNPDLSKAVRYAMLDAGGKVVEEVVVGETPDGWRGVRYDSCG